MSDSSDDIAEFSRAFDRSLSIDDRSATNSTPPETNSHRVNQTPILDPFRRSPETGAHLLESFRCTEQHKNLKDPLALFMETRTTLISRGTKPAFTALQKEAFDLSIQAITERERDIWRTDTLERMGKAEFSARWSESQIHSAPCSPSGHPGQILHVILDCPTLDRRSCTSLEHGILDPKNKSMRALMGKGFSEENCFIFDSFPRRVKFGDAVKKRDAREIWPEFKVCHDALHREYRQHGGQVTLVMGDFAEKRWREILKSERVEAEKLNHSEGFDVWGELSRMDCERRISRVVIKVNHPANFTTWRKGKKSSSVAVTMDNGCNFAFALAGIADFEEAYFTDNHCTSVLPVPFAIANARHPDYRGNLY